MGDTQAPAWASIAEIVSTIFDVQVARKDLWDIAACSRVSRLWQRVANRTVLCNGDRLSNGITQAAAEQFRTTVHKAKGDIEPYTPRSPPFRSGERLALYYNALLQRRVIGRGSFSRVYHFGGIRSLCVKVASGGLTDSEVLGKGLPDQATNEILLGLEHRPGLTIHYLSSGRAVELLPHSSVTFMLAFEFLRLQALAKLPLPSNETVPLYPRPYYFGYVAQTSYYVMEKLDGVTLRHVLRSAAPFISYPAAGPSFDSSDLVEIDFAPLVIRLLGYMHFIMQSDKSFHGDIKPENIMLVPEGVDGWRLRLIDPIPRSRDSSLSHIISLAYNPALNLSWTSDLLGVVLVLFELHTGLRPFDRLVALKQFEHDLSPSWHADLREILQRLFGKGAGDWMTALFTMFTSTHIYKTQFLSLSSLVNTPRVSFRVRVPRGALPVRPEAL